MICGQRGNRCRGTDGAAQEIRGAGPRVGLREDTAGGVDAPVDRDCPSLCRRWLDGFQVVPQLGLLPLERWCARQTRDDFPRDSSNEPSLFILRFRPVSLGRGFRRPRYPTVGGILFPPKEPAPETLLHLRVTVGWRCWLSRCGLSMCRSHEARTRMRGARVCADFSNLGLGGVTWREMYG